MCVIARNTAFTYRDKPIDAKQIGHELGVRRAELMQLGVA
jgi:TolB-like protein